MISMRAGPAIVSMNRPSTHSENMLTMMCSRPPCKNALVKIRHH